MTDGKSRRILLVEENADHAELIQLALKDSPVPLDLKHISDGQSAMDYLLAANGQKPHLVLLDLRMPGIDGLEMLETVRSRHNLDAVPFVVLSTSNADSDKAAAYERRANGYLVKPVRFQEFKEMLFATVAFWLRWNQTP